MWKNYIRTNNKIYKVKEHFMLPLDYPKFSVYGSNETFYEGKVDGANDIQTLLDEFVVIDGKYIANYHNFKIAKNIKGELYGGILTPDGRSICVAKYDKEKESWVLL